MAVGEEQGRDDRPEPDPHEPQGRQGNVRGNSRGKRALVGENCVLLAEVSDLAEESCGAEEPADRILAPAGGYDGTDRCKALEGEESDER